MRLLVACLAICAGCSQRGGEVVRLPLAPAQPQRFHLDVEGGMAEVRLTAPAGYHLQELEDVVFDTRQDEIGDPTILVQAIAIDAITNKPRSYALRDENCEFVKHPTGEWHVLLRTSEANGVTLVCEEKSADRISTVVVRELTWQGHSVQCEVRFSFGTHDQRYVEPTPTKARVDDAIEVCKSMQLRGIVAEQP